MRRSHRARAIGINHVALEVRDVEETLRFYRELFDFELRGRGEGRAFLDLGDQFIALFEGRSEGRDEHRHFGLVVDDKVAVRRRLAELGIEPLPGRFLDFLDPSGNRIQVVEYGEIQFQKSDAVLAAMGLGALPKSAAVLDELEKKGMTPG